jgi:large subunit ribosomal protein L32
MAVPKKRRSKSRKRTHRSLWKIALPTMASCPQCHVLRIAHRACTSCGYYKGSVVLKIKENQPKEA